MNNNFKKGYASFTIIFIILSISAILASSISISDSIKKVEIAKGEIIVNTSINNLIDIFKQKCKNHSSNYLLESLDNETIFYSQSIKDLYDFSPDNSTTNINYNNLYNIRGYFTCTKEEIENNKVISIFRYSFATKSTKENIYSVIRNIPEEFISDEDITKNLDNIEVDHNKMYQKYYNKGVYFGYILL